MALFKLMPRDIVKNPDVKSNHVAFSSIDWKQIEGMTINLTITIYPHKFSF